MDLDKRWELVKKAIEKGEIDYFRDIFIYVNKTQFATKAGLNYKRFVSSTLHLNKVNYGDTNYIAKVLNVDPKLISSLIHNELAALKRPIAPKRQKKAKSKP